MTSVQRTTCLGSYYHVLRSSATIDVFTTVNFVSHLKRKPTRASCGFENYLFEFAGKISADNNMFRLVIVQIITTDL